MNQQEILKKIGAIITELKEQHTYLQANGDDFNHLELELFMANAHFLTDHIEILKKIYGQPKPAALPIATSVFTIEEVYNEIQEIPDSSKEDIPLLLVEESVLEKTENVPFTEIIEAQSPEEPIVEAIHPEVIVLPESFLQEDKNDFSVMEDASFTVQKIEEAEKTATEPEILFAEPEVVQAEAEVVFQPKASSAPVSFVAEVLPEPVKTEPVRFEIEPILTLNERIAAQKAVEKAATVSSTSTKPVQDLQALINLNDKLLFVKELFNGYNLSYAEAINILNRYTSFEQAEHFLNINYTVKNNWKDKPATVERFYEVLRKRFGLV